MGKTNQVILWRVKMSRASKNTVRSKVARRVVVAILITVLAISTVNLIYMSRQIMKEQHIELGIATDLCASNIVGWLGEMEGICEGIANSLEALDTMDEETTRSLIDQVARNHSELFFVYVATEEGDMYMSRGAQFVKNMDVRERVWYKTAKSTGHTIVTDPYTSATRPDTMLITVASPVYQGSKLLGVVGVDASIDSVRDYINSINFKDEAYGFLVDSEGNIIVHKNEEYNPKPDEKVKAIDVIPEINKIIKHPGSEYVVAKDYSGQSMVYSSSRIKDSGWTLVVAYPRQNIMAYVDRGIRMSLFVAILCILLAAGGITKTIKKMLRPIEKINPVMDKIIAGDFSDKINFEAGEDEIGELQTKISKMLDELSATIEQQKYVLGEMEKGNLMVEDMDDMPGELNQISKSVNSIKESFNDIISDIQFSAINLQSFAVGVNEGCDLEEMKMVFEELSAEANALMEKTSKFRTTLKATDDKILSETMH